MKFLLITNHSYMFWQFRRELVSALLERGEVVLSMPFVGHEDDLKAMGCRCINTTVDRRGVNPAADSELIKTYRKLLEKEKPDMVLTYSIKPNIYAGRLCSKMNIPYGVNVQGLGTAFQKEPIASIVTLLYRRSMRKAKAVFFENESNANEFVRRRIVTRDRMTVLKGAGVNLDVYTQQPYPSEKESIRFLYVGRIMREKGMDELLYAAETIKKKYGNKVQFDFVGFFEDDYKPRMEQLQSEGILTLHGFTKDPRPYYAQSHCVVLPSYHEGMSNVLLEAAATGRALIASDIPGCREAVDEGINGFLCKKMDRESLVSCMERFIALPADERERMGAAGRAKMEREFDKKSVVASTLAALGLL
ncbi:MAG: glycosyltransferase family 4 protein [Clostridia bacterium]|nr:glycosyltransferase family 4 protein [Clostridia bacterium]